MMQLRRMAGKSLSRVDLLARIAPCVILCLGAMLPLADPALGGTQHLSDPQVKQFTPQGTVKHVRQVSARFSDPMVPLGDPRSIVDPFAIDCPEPGTARWADSLTWLYDFTRDLPGGVRCTFQLRAGVATLAGKALSGQRTFTFSTGGPAIHSSVPSDEAISSEDQAFVLALDAPATEESVLAHVFFSAEPIPERIGVHILTGETREAILKTLYG
jgi:alpha-2-macroglobulin